MMLLFYNVFGAKVLTRKQRTESKNKMLYQDLGLAFRILRDFVGNEIDSVRIDSKLSLKNYLNLALSLCLN